MQIPVQKVHISRFPRTSCFLYEIYLVPTPSSLHFYLITKLIIDLVFTGGNTSIYFHISPGISDSSLFIWICNPHIFKVYFSLSASLYLPYLCSLGLDCKTNILAIFGSSKLDYFYASIIFCIHFWHAPAPVGNAESGDADDSAFPTPPPILSVCPMCCLFLGRLKGCSLIGSVLQPFHRL